MLLAVDIGNTNVTCAVMKGSRVIDMRSLEDNALKTTFKRALLRINKKFPQINDVILCSVVPNTLKTVTANRIKTIEITKEHFKTLYGNATVNTIKYIETLI